MIAAIHGILEQGRSISFPFNGYAQFDGVDDYAIMPNAQQNNSLNKLSVFFRVNFTTGVNTVLLEKSNNNTNYFIQTGGTNIASAGPGRLLFGVNGASGSFTVSPVLNDGLWHTVMFTYDGTGAAGLGRVFSDGALRTGANSNMPVAPTSNAQNWLVGSRSGVGSFPGKVANLIMYNRILALADFLELEAGRAPVDGVVGAYPMQGNMNDISSYANHGTEFNGVTYGTI